MNRAWSRKNLWERLPGALRAPVGGLLGCLPPAWVLGRRFRAQLRFVKAAQRWSAEQARDYQLAQLKRICEQAAMTTFYSAVFRRAGFHPGDLKQPEDIAGLPLIDKDVIREHLHEMLTVPPTARGVDYVATGGTSGAPLNFFIGADRSATEYAYLVAGWERAGYRLSMPQAVFRAQLVEEDRRGLRHAYDRLLRRHYYSNFHMSDPNMARYLDHLAGIGSCYLHVYPSSVAALARFIRRSGLPAPGNVRGILAGSENVYPDERRLVEEVFPVRYFSWYGHSEKLVLAAECEQSSDYHVWPTYGYFELLDPRLGEPMTTPGQSGEMVGTGFINRVMPFIRYRTGDHATWAGQRCPSCGRECPIIREVQGRWPQGHLIAVDGAAISMTALNIHDDTLERVRGYQFRQSVPGQAVLCVVPGEGFSDRDRRELLARVNRRLQGQVVLTVELRQALDQTERGKQPRVIHEPAMSSPPRISPVADLAAGERL